MPGERGYRKMDTTLYSIYHDLLHGDFEYHHLSISLVVALLVVLVATMYYKQRHAGANTMGQSRTTSSDDTAAASCTERGARLCDKVFLLHEPVGQPEVEIVFIHGLQLGDSKDAYLTTWLAKDGSQNNYWPMTWLADECPNARILSISYDASVSKTSKTGTWDFYQLGESLVQEMVLTGVDIGQHGCPVVFVGHGLGGLVAKEIVVRGYEKFGRDRRICKLLRNTKSFFFYATPHGGSKLGNVIGWISQWIPFLAASPLVDYFKIMNHESGRLNSEFERIHRKAFNNKWKFFVVAETHATLYMRIFSSMVVMEPSVRYVGYDDVMHVAADHFDVCKPKSKTDTSFKFLTECISKVVEDYKCNKANISGLPRLVVGVDVKLSVLREKMKKNPIVGLVGMGGIGKTTLSKIMYNSDKEDFEGYSYLENVKSHSNMLDFQKQLLRDLCDGQWNKNDNAEVHLKTIEQCIMNKKVLVVIDDAGIEKNLKDLLVLAFKNGTGGSKLVITCRNRAILYDYVHEEAKMEVDGLNDRQAMELFCHYAFHEMDSGVRVLFLKESVCIVKACAGLPLSIEVIGQHLRKQNSRPEEDRMEIWKEALRRLEAAEAFGGHRNDDEKLWEKLRISYDDLEDLEKDMFLDFACIFSDVEVKDKNSITRIWNSRTGLQNLIDSSLIKVAPKSRIRWRPYVEMDLMFKRFYPALKEELVMHDQLRDLGRRIVKDLAKKDSQKHMTRMWEESKIEEFFDEKESSKTLEGLSLVCIKNLWDKQAQEFQTSSNETVQGIQQCSRMRLLNLSSSGPDVVEYFLKKCAIKPQNLAWICLNKTEIIRSQLGTLDAKFKGLRVLQLSDCLKLHELPSSTGDLTSLRELNLKGCQYLKSLPDTIGNLINLQILKLQLCRSLKELPMSIGNLVQLLELHVKKCPSLHSLPTSFGNLKLLKLIDLRRCKQLKRIPSDIGRLTKLERLLLFECSSLLALCEFDTKMHHLNELNLGLCENLESFNSLGNLYCLRKLSLEWCHKLCIPNLPECLGEMSQLQYLNLNGCDRMAEEVEDSLRKGQLCTDHLEVLKLSAFPETGLPSCPRLKFLLLNQKTRKQQEELPESFGQSLGNCKQMQGLHILGSFHVPESFFVYLGNLTQLRVLSIADFHAPKDSLRHLTQLRELFLEEKTVELPDSLRRLEDSKRLYVGWFAYM